MSDERQLDKQAEKNKKAHRTAKTLGKASAQADRQARERDARTNAAKRKKQEPPNIALVDEEERKANQTGHTIVKIRDRNRARFAQVISENVFYLINKGYIDFSELGFITALGTTLELHSNAVIKHVPNSDGSAFISTGEYFTISGLASAFKYSTRHTRRLVSQLIDKGIVYELVDTQSLKKYGRVIEERPLFANPELIFVGDRNRINATLARIILNADHLEASSMKLPWKLWIKSGSEYGQLYRRKTYLKYKKESLEASHIKGSSNISRFKR